MKKVKQLLTALLTVMMMLTVGTTSVMADDLWAGDASLTIKASANDRFFVAYQVFKADSYAVDASGNKTLGNIVWGASVQETYQTALLTALVNAQADNAKMPDGSAVPEALVDALKGTGTSRGAITTSSTAAQVAEALNGLGDDSDAIDAFADIVENVIAKEGNESKNLTLSSGILDSGNHEYILNNISDGYYMVCETTGTDANAGRTYSKTLLRLAGPSEVNLKAKEGPSIDKTTNGSHTGTVSAGDEVEFTITSAVPSDIAKYTSGYYFIVEDTMSKGLKYVADSMSIKVGDDTVTVETGKHSGTETKYATLTETEGTDEDAGKTTLKIVFNKFNQYTADAIVTITYKGLVTKDATSGKDASTSNNASLTYSNDPSYDYGGKNEPGTGEPTGKVTTTTSSTVKLYSTSITINKVDSDQLRLEGASFKITGTSLKSVVTYNRTFTRVLNPTSGTEYYYQNDKGEFMLTSDPAGSTAKKVMYTYSFSDTTYSQTSEDADDAEYYQYTAYKGEDETYKLGDGETVKYISITAYDQLSTEEKEKFTFTEGYAAYSLTTSETETSTSSTPTTGYATAKNGQLTFTDLGAGEYEIEETVAPEGKNKLKSKINVKVECTINNDGTATWKYTVNYNDNPVPSGNTTTYTVSSSDSNTDGRIDANGGLVMNVVNNAGSTMPQTGGIGTTIFYVVGGLLVVGAGVLLVVKKRMNAEQ